MRRWFHPETLLQMTVALRIELRLIGRAEVTTNARAAAGTQTQQVDTASVPAAAAPGSGTGPVALTAEALETLSDPLSLDEIRPRNYSTGSLEEFLARQQSTDSLADKQNQENVASACPTP